MSYCGRQKPPMPPRPADKTTVAASGSERPKLSYFTRSPVVGGLNSRSLFLADMREGRDFNERVGLHETALDAISGRLVARKELSIDLVDGAVVRPIRDEDRVERHVVHRAAGGLDDRFDRGEDMLGLGRGIADVNDVVVLVERKRAGDIDDAVGERPWRVGGKRLSGAGR